MTYIEYMSMPRKQQVSYKLKEGLHKVGQGFVGFFLAIGRFFKKFGKNTVKAGHEVGYAVKNGDVWTRLSFLFLGTSHIARGQVLKGIVYLLIEALFVFYMITTGGQALVNLVTLGTVKTHYYCSFDGATIADGYSGYVFTDQGAAATFCNQVDLGNGAPGMIYTVAGQRSSLMLLFGILAVLIIFLFISFYARIIKSSIDVQEQREAHQHLNTAFEDFQDMLDKKFYLTLLFFPVLGICAFTILPLIDMIMMAFTNYDQSHQNLFSWVGNYNFNEILGISGNSSSFSYTFWHILGWTLVWAFFATFLNYFLGMLLAMLINKKGIKLKKFWRTLFVFSIAVPQFVSLMTWGKFMSSSGFFEQLFKLWGWMGIDDKLSVMDNANSARIAVILINTWIGIPYTMLITTGILMNIPADLYESAQIDGAKPARVYFKITLPYIFFVTGPYLITQFVGNINNFNVIYFLTGGKPLSVDYLMAGKTDLLVTWLYNLTVNNSQYSKASVIGIMIFIVSAFFSLIAYRNSSAMKNEEDFA